MDKSEGRLVFEAIRASLPTFRIETEADSPAVDVSMRIPVQDALPFEVNLALSDDVLHLTAGDALWLQWSPASDARVVERYRDAVLGLFSGRYRIVEYLGATHTVKAELQRLSGPEWDTVGTWHSLIPSRLFYETRVLQYGNR